MELTIDNITKSFGEKVVLKGISLRAQGGKALGLLGRNGAGKTTTIRIVMNVFPPDSGRVLLDDGKLDIQRVRVGYLPEERGLYPKKLISEQLYYLGCLRGMKRSEAKASAKRLLHKLGMEEYLDKKLDTLSKGNQQKIQLAATLINDPEIVILDEPFSGLDPVNAMLLKDLVREMIAKGKVVLFSSHQMGYIEEFCDDIAILNGGKIVLSGGIREIKRSYDRSDIVLNSPQCPVVEQFLQTRCKEFVKGLDQNNGELIVHLTDAGQKGRLMEALSQSEYEIDGFRVYEPSLNDIFVRYTEEEV